MSAEAELLSSTAHEAIELKLLLALASGVLPPADFRGPLATAGAEAARWWHDEGSQALARLPLPPLCGSSPLLSPTFMELRYAAHTASCTAIPALRGLSPPGSPLRRSGSAASLTGGGSPCASANSSYASGLDRLDLARERGGAAVSTSYTTDGDGMRHYTSHLSREADLHVEPLSLHASLTELQARERAEIARRLRRERAEIAWRARGDCAEITPR